jgi:hypothetical protein
VKKVIPVMPLFTAEKDIVVNIENLKEKKMDKIEEKRNNFEVSAGNLQVLKLILEMIKLDELTEKLKKTIYKSKKPKLLMNGHSDEMMTPEVAINPLIPYLKKEWLIWECAWGKGSLAKHLENKEFMVFGNKEDNFFEVNPYFDCIITNPPYSLKDRWLEKCYNLGKPFALLLPLTALEGKKRGKLYKKYGIQLIIPNKRINFITPSGKGSGSWFQVAWFCWGLNLPKDLMFVNLEEEKNGN